MTKEKSDDAEAFVAGYLRAALWSTPDPDDENGDCFDAVHDEGDFAVEAVVSATADCALFARENAARLAVCYASRADYGPASAGQDFWFTRNRHGTGFWDRGFGLAGERLTAAAHDFGGVDIYKGDDGRLHFA